MFRKFILTSFTLLILSSLASSQIIFRGQVIDASTGFSIPGANIVVDSLSLGTITDESGHFILNLSPGRHLLKASYVGYVTFLAGDCD